MSRHTAATLNKNSHRLAVRFFIVCCVCCHSCSMYRQVLQLIKCVLTKIVRTLTEPKKLSQRCMTTYRETQGKRLRRSVWMVVYGKLWNSERQRLHIALFFGKKSSLFGLRIYNLEELT